MITGGLQFGGIQLHSMPGQPELKTSSRRTPDRRWDEASVWVAKTGNGSGKQELAKVSQPSKASSEVRFFNGKGGFCAIVTTDDLTYIALPGSRIKLPDTILELSGKPIQSTSKAKKTSVTPPAVAIPGASATSSRPPCAGMLPPSPGSCRMEMVPPVAKRTRRSSLRRAR